MNDEHHRLFNILRSSKDFQKVWEESKLPINFKFGEHTPLSIACVGGNEDAVKYLIENGADVNERAKPLGYTPLMFASEYAYLNIIKLLLEKGACTGTFGRQEKSAPLILLISKYETYDMNGACKPEPDYWQCMDYLLANTKPHYFKEALEETYYRDFKEVLVYLLNNSPIPFETISSVISSLLERYKNFPSPEIAKVWNSMQFCDKLETNLNKEQNLLNKKIKI